MAGQELLWLSLSVIVAQIQRKEMSPVELTGAVLERLEQLSPRLNAFITILGAPALQAAQQAERGILAGRRCGPLHGVPLALKDIFAIRGVRTTAGSQVPASM